MDYEISHVNVHLGEDKEDRGSTIMWHKDSYLFVVILMVRDTSTTGELELRSGTGKVIKTPRMGRVSFCKTSWISSSNIFCYRVQLFYCRDAGLNIMCPIV
jgi:hypothetical protein